MFNLKFRFVADFPIVKAENNKNMKNKPNIHLRMKILKTTHRHNYKNDFSAVHNIGRTVCIIVTTIILLAHPSIVKCDRSIYNEIDNGSEVHAKNTLTELPGGRIIGEKWLRQLESPYSLQTDLTIERSGKLFIEPGVTVHVAPMVGVTVRGVLTALVRDKNHFK